MSDFISTYASVVWVTLAYIGVYYAILLYGLFTKRRVARMCKENGEPFQRYSQRYPELLAADRMQLNTLEHMPPFLVLLWLQATVVSPLSATLLGAFYVVVRITYPFFLGRELRRSFPLRVLYNTFTGYAILSVMAGWQVWTLLA